MRYFLFALAAVLPIACSAADSSSYQVREHYMPATRSMTDANPSQPDVYEIFWYGCPHCYHFEPKVKAWEKTLADDVNFVRLPASLGRPQGILHSKAFYTAEALGMLDEIHSKIFHAIHERNQRLASEEDIEALFVNAGVMPDVFRQTFNSFAVENKVQQAENIIRGLGIRAVPSMSVDLRHWTSTQQAGNFDGMLDVVDHLIKQSRDSS